MAHIVYVGTGIQKSDADTLELAFLHHRPVNRNNVYITYIICTCIFPYKGCEKKEQWYNSRIFKKSTKPSPNKHSHPKLEFY